MRPDELPILDLMGLQVTIKIKAERQLRHRVDPITTNVTIQVPINIKAERQLRHERTLIEVSAEVQVAIDIKSERWMERIINWQDARRPRRVDCPRISVLD